MKDKLRQIEAQLQNIIEGQATRLLGLTSAEEKLARRLVQAMEAQIHQDQDGNLTAPNIFTINVPAKFAPDVRANQALLDTLAQSLMEAGEQAGIQFQAAITINVFPDESIEAGRFIVQAMWKQAMIGETKAMPSDGQGQVENEIPPKAFLIVGGSKIFSLDIEVVNLGRKLDNHLVIDDPRVSRKHGQLRAVDGRFMIFDLESAGGTFVNGERVNQAVLHPGDVISLAGVPMVYGQDAVRSIGETQEYQRPMRSSTSTTNTITLDDLDLDTFKD